MTKIRQFLVIILILCLAILLHSCGQMTAEDEGLDSKSIDEASGSTGITTDDASTTDNTISFLAAGDSGTILTSSTGTSWFLRTDEGSHVLNGITYARNIFVAVGGLTNFIPSIFTSSDGISWTCSLCSGNRTGVSEKLYGVSYGNGILFVAIGKNASLYTSSDGLLWTSRWNNVYAAMSYYLQDLFGVTYGNSIFVAGGGNGTILTSSDGVTWNSRTSGTSNSLRGVGFGNSKFVAVGSSGTILTSSDNGTTWTSRTSGTSTTLYGATYDNGKYVVVGASGTILTSPDGTLWTSRTSGTTNSLNGITSR